MTSEAAAPANSKPSIETVYAEVQEIILDSCDLDDLDITEIKETDNLVSDIGIDSVDFLDAVFDIEQKYDVTIPIDEWMTQVNEAEADGENVQEHMLMGKFVESIYELINQ